jgi:hypothetical protein
MEREKKASNNGLARVIQYNIILILVRNFVRWTTWARNMMPLQKRQTRKKVGNWISFAENVMVVWVLVFINKKAPSENTFCVQIQRGKILQCLVLT